MKYLLNNRKHATYWNCTRDTAVCIEAMADYLKASGEDKPDMTVEVWLDGKKQKEVKIDADEPVQLRQQAGARGRRGRRRASTRSRSGKQGTGPVYFNAYLTNFTLEDLITKAGLEVKVNRKYYKLTRDDKKIKVAGSRGQAVDQKVEKYERTRAARTWPTLKSGDLVEVELEIDSKNDYEYLIFEDFKAAGFEPVRGPQRLQRQRHGRLRGVPRRAGVLLRPRRWPAASTASRYRLRAEIPGKFMPFPPGPRRCMLRS